MKRVIAHWTAGAGRASREDKEHYHLLVEYDGSVVRGKEDVEDNIVTSDGDYAAHTAQFNAFCKLVADLCVEYGIPVTPQTVLTHAEVQTTLGVQQRGKWDVARLPWRDDLRGARSVGDYMRQRITLMLGGVEVLQTNRPTLRFGDKSVDVGVWQVELSDRGYHLGRADKDFGRLTRAATLAFQADNGLPSDGVVDADDWLQVVKAAPRPERFVTQEEIDRESGTAQDAQMTARVGDLVGIGGVAGIATQAKQAGDVAQAASGVMG